MNLTDEEHIDDEIRGAATDAYRNAQTVNILTGQTGVAIKEAIDWLVTEGFSQRNPICISSPFVDSLMRPDSRGYRVTDEDIHCTLPEEHQDREVKEVIEEICTVYRYHRYLPMAVHGGGVLCLDSSRYAPDDFHHICFHFKDPKREEESTGEFAFRVAEGREVIVLKTSFDRHIVGKLVRFVVAKTYSGPEVSSPPSSMKELAAGTVASQLRRDV